MNTVNPTRKSQHIHPKGRISKPFSQAERLARMVRILASRSVTIKALADEFLVSRRQIRRDLIRIEEQGHPLSRQLQGTEVWWSLPLGYKGLPPITISLNELFSLHLAKSELQYLEGTPFSEELDQVFQKMQAGLPTKTVNHLERIVKVFHLLQRIKRAYAKQSSVLINLRKALLLQLKVVLQYRKPGSPRKQSYHVDPYTLLVLYQGGLYLRGFSHGANAMRTFAVERIKQVDLMDWEPHLAELKSQGIKVHQTNRGGSVTYHGPGQIIGYPILKLRNFCRGPKVYVEKLKEVLIRTLADWEIAGCRHESFRGVWVNTEKGHLEKIASIGVRISKGITMHGFALNVNVDLRPFSLLSPCGIENCAMTSMAKQLDQQVNVLHVKERLATHFAQVFRLELAEQK